MRLALDLFTIVAVLAGAFFFLAGTVGLLRFPDTLTRLHALSKADNLGLGLIVLGLLPRVDSTLVAVKLVCVWLLVLLSGATVAQLIQRFNLPKTLVHLVLINGHFVPPAAREARLLREGDVLAIWPPIAGG